MSNCYLIKHLLTRKFFLNGLSLDQVNPYKGLTYLGIHANFSQVKASYEVTDYHTEESLAMEKDDAEKVAELYLSGDRLNPGPRQNFFWENIHLVSNRSKVSILDVGSGVRPIMAYGKLPQSEMQVTLLEIPETISILRNSLRFGNVKLTESIYDLASLYDCIFLGSSLQYFESWKEVLTDLASKCTGIILIADTPIGKIETFACAQVNTWPRILCRWVFSIDEITSLMENLGFKLVKEEKTSDQKRFQNFPIDYQEIYHTNLLYSRL